MKKPIIPKSYEDVVLELGGRENALVKLMEFYKPLTGEEKELQTLQGLMGSSGKMVFLFGQAGSGKSSFVESLSMRPHLGINSIVHIQAELHSGDEGLREILGLIKSVADDAKQKYDLGRVVVVLDYLESLSGYPQSKIKEFFQTLNGILRNSKLLLLWPVVDNSDLQSMLNISKSVSGTMFVHNRDTININGPLQQDFPSIAETTIQVMNEGKLLNDFGITRGDLEEVLDLLNHLPKNQRTIRRYLELVEERWIQQSNYIQEISHNIPKPTEICFIFPFPGSEDKIRNFSRKGVIAEDSWLASHDALFEYIPGTQRASFWDAKKLQLAIAGVFKSRILFQPGHTTVAAIRAFTDNTKVINLIDTLVSKNGYKQKSKATKSFLTTPIIRQLTSEPPLVGKRKSGPAAIAETESELVYDKLVKWISSGAGSDRPYNHAIAACIAACIEKNYKNSGISVSCEKDHPYIPNIRPDILVDTPSKVICIEFHYTNQKEPNVVADYVLTKLKVYMEQVETMLAKTKI